MLQSAGVRPVLVTGATGTLGREVTRRLLDEGREVRALSRRERPDSTGIEWVADDLLRPRDLDAVLDGVETVVHCASNPTSRHGDVEAARNLIGAARRAGVGHVVYISIVGVDQVPLGYYRAKYEVERFLKSSGVGFTILRATQFHDLVLVMLRNLARLPVVPLPAEVRFQPVDVGDVAQRLVRLALDSPAGRVADLGGPRVHTSAALLRSYLRASGKRRRVLPVRVPGKVFRGYRAGGHLAPENAEGRVTFDEFLDRRFGVPPEVRGP